MPKGRKSTKHDPLSESCYSEASKKYAPFLKVFRSNRKIFPSWLVESKNANR